MKNYSYPIVFVPLIAVIYFIKTTPLKKPVVAPPVVVKVNTLTASETKKGWTLLFNGTNTEGWHVFKKETDGSAWKVDGDALTLDPSVKGADGKRTGFGDLVTNGEFENYELRLDWKISACGNSGIIFNAIENDSLKASYHTGPEMQILDNSCHPDAKIAKHKAGDLYDLIPCSEITVKPAGEWNSIRLIVKKGHLEQWQNGKRVVAITMWTPEWSKMIANSKFKNLPLFGKIKKGHLVLQDHGNQVWFRNVKIKEFK